MRSPGQLGLEKAKPRILAVDKGATKTIMEYRHGDYVRRERYPTPRDYDTTVQTLGAKAHMLSGGKKIDAGGVAVGGELDVVRARIIRAGQLHAYGWTDKPLKTDIASALGISPEALDMWNDCVGAAIAEHFAALAAGNYDDAFVKV